MKRSVSPSLKIVIRRPSASFSVATMQSTSVRRSPIFLWNTALSSEKKTCVFSPGARRGSAVADHHSFDSVSRRKMKLPAAVLARIRDPPRHRLPVPARIARAGRRQHDRIVPVRQQHRRPIGLQRIDDGADLRPVQLLHLGRLAFLRLALHRQDRDLPGRLFLQQELRRLDHRIGMEARAQPAVEDDVRDGGDRHALMVGHVVVDDRAGFALRHPRRREIDRVVETVAAERAELLQPAGGSRGPLPARTASPAARHMAR